MLRRSVVNVHEAEIKIFTVVATVSGFIVVLEPIGPDDVRNFQESLERIAKSSRAFFLRERHRIDAAIVFVAAAVFAGGHVELTDKNRFASERVKCFQIKTRES